jgi:hypothetical protein
MYANRAWNLTANRTWIRTGVDSLLVGSVSCSCYICRQKKCNNNPNSDNNDGQREEQGRGRKFNIEDEDESVV